VVIGPAGDRNPWLSRLHPYVRFSLQCRIFHFIRQRARQGSICARTLDAWLASMPDQA
jgi:hypothetical protein